jgi:hypothetical protein
VGTNLLSRGNEILTLGNEVLCRGNELAVGVQNCYFISTPVIGYSSKGTVTLTPRGLYGPRTGKNFLKWYGAVRLPTADHTGPYYLKIKARRDAVRPVTRRGACTSFYGSFVVKRLWTGHSKSHGHRTVHTSV